MKLYTIRKKGTDLYYNWGKDWSTLQGVSTINNITETTIYTTSLIYKKDEASGQAEKACRGPNGEYIPVEIVTFNLVEEK